MKEYGAIDLHSNNNVTVLIDEQDRVVYEKRLPNDLSMITQQLSAYQDSLQGIVVESTFNLYWLVDGLMDQGHKVHLANTAAIQQYQGLKYTDWTAPLPLESFHRDLRWARPAVLVFLSLISYSSGGKYPRAECNRFLLYTSSMKWGSRSTTSL